MKPINIKRWRLVIAIACILLAFALIIVFVHGIFHAYYKAKVQVTPDYYRRKMVKLITEIDTIEVDIKGEVRKKLWDMCEDPDFANTKELSPELISEIKEISDFTMVSYITVSFIILLIGVLLTIWYKSGEKNLVISVEEEKKPKKT